MPPPLDCGMLAAGWNPLPLEELELFEELELAEPELDDPDPLELEPVELEPVELEPVDELPLTAAWLEPGRTATTTPATATLARPTVTVVAFSRRRPCSRSATASATWRARSRAVCPCQLFTLISLTWLP
jgi:hypothetical protein